MLLQPFYAEFLLLATFDAFLVHTIEKTLIKLVQVYTLAVLHIHVLLNVTFLVPIHIRVVFTATFKKLTLRLFSITLPSIFIPALSFEL
jgi:hypothetical protein